MTWLSPWPTCLEAKGDQPLPTITIPLNQITLDPDHPVDLSALPEAIGASRQGTVTE